MIENGKVYFSNNWFSGSVEFNFNDEAHKIAKEIFVSQLQVDIKRRILELKQLQEENKELSRIVASKVISDYDIDTPLKKELGAARLKIVSLEDALHCYKQEKEDLIKWLETYAEFNTDDQSIEKTLNEVLDKVRGINND